MTTEELLMEVVRMLRERRPKARYSVDRWGDLYEVNPTE